MSWDGTELSTRECMWSEVKSSIFWSSSYATTTYFIMSSF